MSELKHTPLHHAHQKLGARIAAFAGFAMPIQYPAGAIHEYKAVREGGAGLFDISHMGQIRISGPDALALVQYAASNDASTLACGQVQYSALLNERGGFIDDITVYKIDEDQFYLCVNAINRDRDAAHLAALAARFDAEVRDESDGTALLALQGAAAQRMLQGLVELDLDRIGYYRFAEATIAGARAIVSRTGYTGEDGFELYLPRDAAEDVWDALLAAGAKPAGLAARDMLRAEMGYALYGHEISEDITPVEAGLMWIAKLEKDDFHGKQALLARKSAGPAKRLIALKLTGKGIPRQHYRVLADNEAIGEVTSGVYSPLAGCGVAMAYVRPEYAKRDALAVEIRGKSVPAVRAQTPFVRSRVKK